MPGIPPWHLWGSVQSQDVDNVASFGETKTAQLCQVSYARPESWRFYFKVAILNIVGSSAGSTLTADFNMTFGVGRATTRVAPFARFIFTPAELSALTVKQITTVELPKNDAARSSNNIIEVIPAQTIQVDVLLKFDILGLILPGTKVETTAFFSPNVHVRPEWQLHDGAMEQQFPGDEHKGK